MMMREVTPTLIGMALILLTGSTSDTHKENKGRHSLGSDAVASEDDRSANPEDNVNNTSKGNGPLIISQNDQEI
ncbi:hypothetical protein Tco_0983571, partial [Tanacetum coccineum]